jgi:hypothetical protein
MIERPCSAGSIIDLHIEGARVGQESIAPIRFHLFQLGTNADNYVGAQEHLLAQRIAMRAKTADRHWVAVGNNPATSKRRQDRNSEHLGKLTHFRLSARHDRAAARNEDRTL